MASGTNSSSNGSTYTYRADGQRLSKVGGPYVYGLVLSPGGPAYYQINTGTATPVERYYYDGTMGFEDSTTASGTTKVSRYGLGARGIDRIEYYDGSSTTYGYPLYDGHGNMRATLYKTSSSPYYGTQNWKTYDVWGSVRTDSGGTPNPKQRYCANLGHVADDETDLVYMRARYYEPSTGRFVSQDPSRDGHNWFVYCNNEPLNQVDPTGKNAVLLIQAIALIAGIWAGWTLGYALSTCIIQALNPGYSGGNIFGNSMFALAGGAASEAAALKISGDVWAGATSFRTFAFMLRLELMNMGGLTPFGVAGPAGGLGLLIGLILGAAYAIWEFYSSNYYAEH